MHTEILFWCVFHNKYLFHLIFKQIEIKTWGVKTKKFKTITSLEWMLNKKQLNLLKCKLEANNEYIYIDEKGITALYKMTELEQGNEVIFKQLFKLILSREETIKGLDLLKLAIQTSNFNAIEILLNEPYKVKIQAPLVKLAIENHNSKIINLIFDLYLSSNNNSTSDIKEIVSINHIFKIDDLKIQNKLMDFECFIYDWESVMDSYSLIIFINSHKPELSIEVLLLYKRMYYKYFTSTPTPSEESLYNPSLKELVIEITKLTKSYYFFKQYLIQNEDPFFINKEDEDCCETVVKLVKHYCIENFSIKALQFLIENKSLVKHDSTYKYKCNSTTNRIIEFIKIYNLQQSIILNEWREPIIKSILIRETKEEYEATLYVYNSTSRVLNSINFIKLPNTWNPLLQILYSNEENKTIKIQDIETINWIKDINNNRNGEFSNYNIKYRLKKVIGTIIFEPLILKEHLYDYPHTIEKEVINILIDSILEFKINNQIESLASNFNYNSKANKIKEFINRKLVYSYTEYFDEAKYFGETANIKINRILESIEFWLNLYKQQKDNSNLLFKSIFNYQFQELIKIPGLKSNQVVKVYNEIISIGGSEFIVHSMYHTLFYLRIRSNKLDNYILNRKGVTKQYIFETFSDMAMEDLELFGPFEDIEFDFRNYLDPSIFTFDFIFGNSFIVVLDQLKSVLSYQHFNEMLKFDKEYEYQTNSCYADLDYYLNISEFNLFIKELDLVKGKLEDINIDFKFIPSAKTIDSMCEYMDINSIETVIGLLDIQEQDLIDNSNDTFYQQLLLGSLEYNRCDILDFILLNNISDGPKVYEIHEFSPENHFILNYLKLNYINK